MIKALYLKLLHADPESKKLLQLIGQHVKADARILDVGCGYGRNLEQLQLGGFSNITGIDINPEIVASNKRRGFNCIGLNDLDVAVGKFDLILMSHVIEHFSPLDLKNFIDGYLDFLTPKGYLVIATPLMSDYFYDDFDHVKPYHPAGILQVFGKGSAQIQYYGKNKLALRDIWFRKGYYRLSFCKANYMKTRWTRAIQAFTFASVCLFFISNGFVGKKDAWVGVFQKVGND
jgi:SAM-dependent methyltransferase